ncbi:MAG: DUF2924 domain-containing protein [Rhodobacteraceae bacterium]|nr:DUF2924 domain-containing protein [Paracoccaceae bacterium]
MNKPDPIPARLAALKTTPTPDLKQQWRELFDSEPPPFNRRYLSRWLPHPGTGLWRAEARDDPAAGAAGRRTGRRRQEEARIRADGPSGTRLLREWQGVEQIVTVTADGFEWQGRPYKSLSAIAAPSPARAGTGGCSSASKPQGADMTKPPEKSKVVRKLRCASTPANQRKGWSRSSTATRPARGLRGVHRQPALRGLGDGPRSV